MLKVSNKKKILILISSLLGLLVYVNFNSFSTIIKRNIHSQNLENSPFKDTYNLSKIERKKIDLPPNKYSEKMWELSMNPIEGRPNIEKLFELQYDLKQNRIKSRIIIIA